MTYKELRKIVEKEFGASRPADIAREFAVTPQVVSNWKARNQVPYKYVKILRTKISDSKLGKGKNRLVSMLSERLDLSDSSFESNQFRSVEKSAIEIIIFFNDKIQKHFILIIAVPLIFLFLSICHIKFISEPVYVSSASILPLSSAQKSSGLSSIAKQYGLSVNDNKSSSLSSAEMFPAIINSRRLSIELLEYEFVTKKYNKPEKLIRIVTDINAPPKKWSASQKKNAAGKVSRMISVTKKRDSPLLTVNVSANESQFASDLTNSVLIVLEKIVSRFKLSNILEKKIFIENRMDEISSDLRLSEENLKVFRERNRNILSSPALLLEQERLLREVAVQSEIYIRLKSEYEMVRIEEASEGSIMQVLDQPEAPGFAVSPKPFRQNTLSIILGIIFVFTFIIGKDWLLINKDKLRTSNNK